MWHALLFISHNERLALPFCTQLVVDLRSIEGNLPGAIEAVFFLKTSSSEDKRVAREAHQHFLNAFHLDSEACPLVMIDLDSTQPFSLAV